MTSHHFVGALIFSTLIVSLIALVVEASERRIAGGSSAALLLTFLFMLGWPPPFIAAIALSILATVHIVSDNETKGGKKIPWILTVAVPILGPLGYAWTRNPPSSELRFGRVATESSTFAVLATAMTIACLVLTGPPEPNNGLEFLWIGLNQPAYWTLAVLCTLISHRWVAALRPWKSGVTRVALSVAITILGWGGTYLVIRDDLLVY